jgi:D-proline reductase (dithiol) PrdB
VSLVARHLEAAGIPTVIVGSARDIVEECGVPRFLFVDFPLGNPCGKPWDRAMQHAIVGGALELLERAWSPRTTVQRPEVWAEGEADQRWRERYMRVGDDNRAALAQAGEARRRLQAGRRQVSGSGE